MLRAPCFDAEQPRQLTFTVQVERPHRARFVRLPGPQHHRTATVAEDRDGAAIGRVDECGERVGAHCGHAWFDDMPLVVASPGPDPLVRGTQYVATVRHGCPMWPRSLHGYLPPHVKVASRRHRCFHPGPPSAGTSRGRTHLHTGQDGPQWNAGNPPYALDRKRYMAGVTPLWTDATNRVNVAASTSSSPSQPISPVTEQFAPREPQDR